MKKLFLVIGLSLPLLAQGTETDIEISKQEQRDNRASKVVKTFQDWDFRKYEAAHKRAHMKDGKGCCAECTQRSKRAQMSRRKKSGQWIKNIVIGGVVWYVGYEMGKDEMKKGRKGKKPMTWTREDKK